MDLKCYVINQLFSVGPSLVVQWLRLCPPDGCRGPRVPSLVRELDPGVTTKSSHATTKIPCNQIRAGTSGKEPACQCRRHRDASLTPGSGRCPGGGHGNPLQYSSLENPTDRGARRATVLRDAKSWTWLKWLSMHAQSQINIKNKTTLYFNLRK